MRTTLRIVAAAVLLALAVLLLAPAAWLDRVLAERTQQRLRLVDAQGLWWNGSGAVATGDGAARVPIAWRVALVPLLRGALVIELVPDAGDGSPSGHVSVRRDAVDVRDLHVRAPAAVVFAFVPTAKALSWGGEIAVQAPAFTWHDRMASGTLDARWIDARVVAGTFSLDLGTVTLASTPNATDRAHALATVVHTTGGDVAVDGTLSDRDGVVDVAVSLAPTATAPEAVRQLVPLLGARDAGGHAQIRWRSDR